MLFLPTHVGPHFAKGETAIGRDRLKPGYVAFSPDSRHLRDAIRELCCFALGRRDSAGIPAGIVCRVVDDTEAAAIRQSIFNRVGSARFNEIINRFQLRSFRHSIDEEYVRHMFNRHSDPELERLRG